MLVTFSTSFRVNKLTKSFFLLITKYENNLIILVRLRIWYEIKHFPPVDVFFNSWHLSARKFIDNARRNSFLVNLGSVNMVN